MPAPSAQKPFDEQARRMMRRALTLARRGIGLVSPNPAVGAVLVKRGIIIGEGWHRGPGQAHAEIAAIHDAIQRGHSPRGGTLFVTLEPCSTHGRTPPCTQTIIDQNIAEVIAAIPDPNPNHASAGFDLLREHQIRVRTGLCPIEATALNPGFNHWIVHQSPFVTVKSAMTLDGKIATASGQSKWITGPRARRQVMKMRFEHDAILVGIETVLQDDPSLTVRIGSQLDRDHPKKQPLRIILDTHARTPLSAKVCQDDYAALTRIIVGTKAPASRVERLRKKVSVWRIRTNKDRISLKALLTRLGKSQVTSLLVEGGGQVNASFLQNRLAHRIAFFYAPKILGGSDSRPAVGGTGFQDLDSFLKLSNLRWRTLPPDLLLTASLKLKTD